MRFRLVFLLHRRVYAHPSLVPHPVLAAPWYSATCGASPFTLPPSGSSTSGQIPSKLNPSSFRVGCRPWSSSGNPTQTLPGQFFLGRTPSQFHSACPLIPPGKGCPPAVLPLPASCPWQPARPSLAPQPFGERTVSTWSAHLRIAAANAGLSPHLECMPSSLSPKTPHSPWAPSLLHLCTSLPAAKYRHVSFHLMLTATPSSCKLSLHVDGQYLPETGVSPVQ